MDLGAYSNIGTDEIEEIVKKNNIDVPRLRGYRLMKNEKPVSQKDMKDLYEAAGLVLLENMITGVPYFSLNPDYFQYDALQYKRMDYYATPDGVDKQIDWSKIHGWKRKNLKFALKQMWKDIKKQYDMFNKYAGRNDILYIHSRIGGDNWPYYKHYVVNEPWFIERVDDAYDNTYCDIYAKITT